MKIKVKKYSKTTLPSYKTEGSSGMDLVSNLDYSFYLEPLERRRIPTGIFIDLPNGTEAQIRARSGLADEFGLTVLNGVGTIDSDYKGEIKILLINLGSEPVLIEPGMRIAQIVFCSVIRVEFELSEEISSSIRGDKGFGSTGVK